MKRYWVISLLLFYVGCGVPAIQSGYTIFNGEQDFFIKNDEFLKANFIQHTSAFPYRISTGNKMLFFHLYIVEATSRYGIKDYGLRAKFQYNSGGDWIFFDSVYLINEKGDRISWGNIKSWDKVTKVSGGGGTYESIDLLINDFDLDLLRSVLMGKNVKCRFSGDFNNDRILSEARRVGAVQTINLYGKLKITK